MCGGDGSVRSPLGVFGVERCAATYRRQTEARLLPDGNQELVGSLEKFLGDGAIIGIVLQIE